MPSTFYPNIDIGIELNDMMDNYKVFLSSSVSWECEIPDLASP